MFLKVCEGLGWAGPPTLNSFLSFLHDSPSWDFAFLSFLFFPNRYYSSAPVSEPVNAGQESGPEFGELCVRRKQMNIWKK